MAKLAEAGVNPKETLYKHARWYLDNQYRRLEGVEKRAGFTIGLVSLQVTAVVALLPWVLSQTDGELTPWIQALLAAAVVLATFAALTIALVILKPRRTPAPSPELPWEHIRDKDPSSDEMFATLCAEMLDDNHDGRSLLASVRDEVDYRAKALRNASTAEVASIGLSALAALLLALSL